MNLYFNINTNKLHVLDTPENQDQIKVKNFDSNNIQSTYNILYLGGDETEYKCVDSIEDFKKVCLEVFNYCEKLGVNNDGEVFNDDIFITTNEYIYFEFGDITDYSPIYYYPNLTVENKLFNNFTKN